MHPRTAEREERRPRGESIVNPSAFYSYNDATFDNCIIKHINFHETDFSSTQYNLQIICHIHQTSADYRTETSNIVFQYNVM